MASQALSYASTVHGNAPCPSSEVHPHEYAFIEDNNTKKGISQSIGMQDLLSRTSEQQQQTSSGWSASKQAHLYPSSHPSQLPAVPSPFGSSMGSDTGRGAGSSSSSGGDGVPVVQQDVFYPSTNSTDMTTDFSFMNRRPTASCSQVIRPAAYYPHTPTSSDAAAAAEERNSTPHITPLRRTQSDTPTRSESTPTPGPPAMRPTLSQQRRRKVASSSTKMQGARATSVQSSASTSTVTPSKMAALFVNTKRLPLRLPSPPICMISDPNADLCAHLRRHGMMIEADEYEQAGDITADFVLQALRVTSGGGAEALLNQTNVFLSQHGLTVNEQIKASAGLPDHFSIPVADLDTLADDHCLTPTHMLAVHGTESMASNETKGLLLPCHASIYVLQCVSLPCFPTSTGPEKGQVKRQLPVVPFRVPRPTEFPTLHRYLYTHDASALLVELLPMKHIARQWDHTKSKQSDPAPSAIAHLSNQPPAPSPPPTVPSSATMALAHLPTQSLFQYAYKIHSAWANGVAIGLPQTQYWSTLDRAWSLVMAALSIKKARIMDTEMRGVQLHPLRNTTT